MLRDFCREKFDIIIQAGQSNSEGYGWGDVEKPYQPTELVWYMNGDFTISLAQELVNGNNVQGNLALPFAQKYIEHGLLSEGRKLLILRCAVGGTGFCGNRWNMTGDLYLRMMDMIRTALKMNTENRIVGFLWHQGEHDAVGKVSYEVHYHHLMGLLQSVHEEFHIEGVPFIAGDFVQQWKNDNLEICIPITKAMRAVCEDWEYGAFVETEGLTSNWQELHIQPFGWEDAIVHFSRRAIYELGDRYFKAFMEIKNKK